MMVKDETGSVLMEFIIVLPIYMLFLGFAFVTGELSLETIHLAGSADRTLALTQKVGSDAETEGFRKYKLAASPDREAWDNGSETEFSYAGDGGGEETPSDYRLNEGAGEVPVFVTDENFKGPWVEMTAAKVEDNYTLSPLTRGMIAYWYRQEFDTTEGVEKLDGPIKEMLDGGGIGRTLVRGKDLEASLGGSDWKYGYYTLRRHDGGRKSYRTWGNGQLVQSDPGEWKSFVYNEDFPAAAGASDHDGIDGGNRPGSPPDASRTDNVATYVRDSDLVDWSNHD